MKACTYVAVQAAADGIDVRWRAAGGGAAAATAKLNRAAFDAQRKLLGGRRQCAKRWPPARAALSATALGDVQGVLKPGKVVFDVGAFASAVATQPQPDGSLAFVYRPVACQFPFVGAVKAGVRQLVRDGQHEYVFDEVK
ncbi:MAG: hypothetical protein U1F19_00265 [Lysobacterales bacterium]